LKVNNGGERESNPHSPRRKKGAFYSAPPMKYGRCRIFRPDYPAPGAKIRPKIRPPYREPRPKVLSRNSRAGLFK
jgi:hypothetical protein